MFVERVPKCVAPRGVSSPRTRRSTQQKIAVEGGRGRVDDTAADAGKRVGRGMERTSYAFSTRLRPLALAR
jgi:hypothetical protein